MRPRIGNQTSFAASRVTEPFEFALANGFDAFEWFPDKRDSGQGWAEEDLPKETRSWISREAASHGISLAVHAPWPTNPLRSPSHEALHKSLEFALDIGAGLLNIHLSLDEGVEAFAESIAPMAATLFSRGIMLSVENTVHTGPEDFNALFSYLRSRHPQVLSAVGMCFDLGHANLYGPTLNDYLAYVDRLDPDLPLVHVHLHENYGDADSHLPLFTGPSLRDDSGIRDLLDRLRRRSFSGLMILEQWPQPPSLLLQARQRLLSLLGDDSPSSAGPGGESWGDLVGRLSEAHRRRRSWRNRLSWVYDALTDPSHPPDRETLAYLAVYLRFLGTGTLPCAEDGGHYRPSHHARTSARIYQALLGLRGPGTPLLIRKIIPWLPSFDSAFTRQEPLTRIRDIAHRNDIPREMKQEIKETLQNKLHRSAGPEDLTTSAALLQRVTRPGAGYSAAFVEEFTRFHEELKEFFNARSLEERLERLAARADGAVAQSVRRFLDARVEAVTSSELTSVLALLTELRLQISRSLPAEPTAERLEWDLADVGTEDYAFVLLSRIVNSFESDTADIDWRSALTSLKLTLANLRLSGPHRVECTALESELAAWSKGFVPGSREGALRLKASLARCRRIAEWYADLILSLLPDAAERLGSALGVTEQVRRVYAESDIRGHLVFQFSRIVTFIERNLPGLDRRTSWDVIVPGTVSGLMLCARDLADSRLQGHQATIAVIRTVTGDEEIPLQVRGLIVGRETPRLSHLAIRARQAGVVFAACRNREVFSQTESLHGRPSVMSAAADEVRIEEASLQTEESAPRLAFFVAIPPRAVPHERTDLIDLAAATPETCGAKAFSLRRLSELAAQDRAGFVTSPAVIVPFSAMDESLRESPAASREYTNLLAGLSGAARRVSREMAGRIRSLIAGLAVPEHIVSGVIGRFGSNAALAVRSSANTEDLDGYSSAGLHESIINVEPSGLAEAVRRVWSSLWTDRAAASRVSAGILHGHVRMAVIIQRMVRADYAFVANTRNPLSGNRDEVYIEIVAGLGETLASARLSGTPYRLLCNRQSGSVVTLDLASFSTAAQPRPGGGISEVTLDYSKVALTTDELFRSRLAKNLGRAGGFIEDAFGRPQDIEGVVSGEDAYIVQSRPQHVGVFPAGHGR